MSEKPTDKQDLLEEYMRLNSQPAGRRTEMVGQSWNEYQRERHIWNGH